MNEENKNLQENENEENNIEQQDNESNNVDVADFLDMLKEKDDQIEQLQKDITELKKSNANLLVKVNAGTKHEEKTFEQNLMGLVGQPTERN